MDLAPETLRPVDPEVRVMTLGNGFGAWIRHHHRPPGSALLWLHVGCGSLDEAEEERGAAHFLEHLAFRGTTSFPPGAATAFLASLGTQAGVHYNASTSLDRTSISLTLPHARRDLLERALLLLAEVAFGMSLLPEEVEGQRRVILEEMRARRQVQARLAEALAPALLPGALAIRRRPLGTEESVRALGPDQLRAFYRRWYRPDTSVLLVAGDVDPAAVERLLAKHFGGWPQAGEAPRRADPGISPLPATRAVVVRDPDLADAQVGLVSARPRDYQRTIGEIRARLVEGMAGWSLARRLTTLIREGRVSFRGRRLLAEPILDVATAVGAVVPGPAGQELGMLAALLTELRRVRIHGFLPEELAVAREATLTAARQGLIGDADRSSGAVLKSLVNVVSEGRPPMSRAQGVSLAEPLLAGVTLDDLETSFRGNFAPEGRLVLAAVPDREEVEPPTEEELLECLNGVERTEVAAPTVRVRPTRLLDRLPPPGSVAAVREDAELGLLSLTLGNGVRVHLRPMDYRHRRVFVRLTLAGGRVREAGDTLGLTTAAFLVLTQPAFAGRSSVQIRDFLTAKALAYHGSVQEDCVTVAISGDPGELAVGLELAHALLSSPRLEAPALARWQQQVAEQALAHRRSLESQLAQRSLELLAGGDPRFRFLAPEETARITLARAQSWLEELSAAPLEVAVVGDFDVVSVVDELLQFLGSLPPRPLADPRLDALRVLPPLAGPVASRVEVETESDRAALLVGWRSAPWAAVRERRLLELAEPIVLRRLEAEVRERAGLSYDVDCSYQPSRAFPEASLLAAAFYCAPERAADGAALARRTVEEVAAAGPTAAELESARQQVVEHARQRDLDPRYWVEALSDIDYRGTNLADLTGKIQQIEGFTAEEVRTALAATVTDERRLEVACVPAPRLTPTREDAAVQRR